MELRIPSTASLLLAALPLLAAPASAALPDFLGAGGERPFPVSVTVEEVPTEDVWNVGYVLPRAVAGVEFVADRNAFRAERWGVGVREGEAVWHTEDGRERICFSAPARAFSVGFRTFDDPLPKDYELNVSFSDGGRLLYTGHLLIRPLAACGPETAEALPGAAEHRFTFTTVGTTVGTTAEERTVRVGDAAGAGTLRWEPPEGDGSSAAETYVYFGDLEPLAMAAAESPATILLDPGLPAWMREEMAARVPELVARYTAVTDTPLPFRPLLLISWGGEEGSGRSFSGGTVPGMLLAAAEGPGWLEASDDARRDWFHHLAHETFHLWDGEAFRPAEDAEWLSEAGAEHFAVEAALAAGVRSEADAARWTLERANDCLVRLGGRSLLDAVGGSDYGSWYSCGAVALAAADGALRRADPPVDLGQLFRRLFEHAAATGDYGAAAFLGGLRELGADEAVLLDLRRLVTTGYPARAELFLQRLLGHAGIEAVAASPAGAAADPATLAAVVRRAVGGCWCGAEAGEGCDPAAIGEDVSAVEGTSVSRDPVAAWNRVVAATRGAELTVTLDGLETTLFCGDEAFDPTWSALLAPAEGAAEEPER